MPTYNYRCEKCQYHFEQFQSITDSPVKKCSRCKGPVRRLISTGAGIIFKGKGFYQTDYKSPAPKCGKASSDDGKPAQCEKADRCPYSKQDDKQD
ncbi:MAG: FmdB family zinc ribbon protein [Candidatus Omnitrophota bacterium]